MNTLARFKLVGISVLLAAGLAACDKPGPAETAGKKIDQTMNKAGEKIGDAADKAGEKIGDAAGKASLKMGEQSDKAGVVINDAETTAKIKAAIFAEPGLKTLQINVDTVKNVVTLSGSVDTQANSDRAKALAGAVLGVKDVDNRLVVKK